MNVENKKLIAELKRLRRIVATGEHLAGFPAAKTSGSQEDKFGDIFANIWDGVGIMSPDGSILEANPAFCHMHGYLREEIIGRNVRDLVHPEAIDDLDEFFDRLKEHGYVHLESFGWHKTGFPVPLEVRCWDYTFQGQPALLGILRDISERLSRESILRRQSEDYQNIFQNIFNGIALLVDGRIVDANPSFVRIFGYGEKSEVLGKSPFHLIREVDHELLKKRMETNFEGVTELRGLRPDGRRVDICAETKNILYRGKPARLVVVSDVTQDKEIHENLILAREEARAASQAKTRFLANMSHEIRTPLGAIVGFSDMLVRAAGERAFPPELLEYIDYIKVAANGLVGIVNDVLDLARIESETIVTTHERVPLDTLIRNVLSMVRPWAEKKSVLLHAAPDPNLPEFVVSDPTKLAQILVNLIGNAIKFTDPGKHVEIKITPPDRERVQFEIVDQGIGIPEDRQAAIFENFEQVDDSITKRFGGTGLGLAIAKKLTELLGGTIGLRSAPGEGSAFSVTIPVDPGKTGAQGDDSNDSAEHAEDYNFQEEKFVLFAEDDFISQQLIKTFLGRLNLKFDMAGDGREALEKTLELKPDLVLLDVHMPEMDGLRAAREIRSNPEFKDMPILALTADLFMENQEKAPEDITEFIIKPVRFNQLARALQKYLGE